MSSRRWKTFADSYKATLLITANTLILFIVVWLLLNGALTLLFHVWDRHFKTNNAVAQRYGGAVEQAYPGWSRPDLDRLLYETWGRPRRFVAERYIGTKEAPFKGAYVNVDPNGYRWSKHPGPWPPDPRFFNIFLFGGSTTFGYGVPDDSTIASWLSAKLNAPGAAREVKIYNFGRGGYYSSTERMLLEQLLIDGAAPQAAIFIDGLNEFESRPNDSMDDSLFNRILLHPTRTFLKEGLHGLVITEPMLRFSRSFGGGVIGWWMRGKKPAPPIVPINEADANAIVHRYVTNKRMIEAICRAYGIAPVFIWQPQPFYNYDLKHHPMGQLNPNRQAQFGYVFAAQQLSEGTMGKNFFWCADIQKDMSGGLYVDSVHYSSKMSETIAQRIGDFMRRRGHLPKRSPDVRRPSAGRVGGGAG